MRLLTDRRIVILMAVLAAYLCYSLAFGQNTEEIDTQAVTGQVTHAAPDTAPEAEHAFGFVGPPAD